MWHTMDVLKQQSKILLIFGKWLPFIKKSFLIVELKSPEQNLKGGLKNV